ncbi:GyrI-like domain-containing protein [Zhengella sp. ZM62]|uniref:GyrI-like domain-containing protein n=1 Tax=Zhengella sedimenti TaxID=3390035 RepID=UPI003976F80C
MLPVTETAFEGAGLSVPSVTVRDAVPYVAIAASGAMADLPRFAPPLFPDLHGWMHERGLTGMAGCFRYKAFRADGRVGMEVAMLLEHAVPGDAQVLAGELPAGRYATATFTGPYDRLHDAFCMLSGWLRGRGLSADERNEAGSRFPVAQAEIYRVTPMDTDDPARWKTDLLVKLAD